MADPYAQPQDLLDDLEGPPRVSGLAVTSLVFGILCCIPVIGLIAVILGAAALIRIRQAEGRLGGKTLAIIAIVLGAIGTLAWLAFGIGTAQFYKAYERGALKPTDAAMKALEAKDLNPARALLEPRAGAKISDADWAAFSDSYHAKFGTFGRATLQIDLSPDIFQPAPGAPAHAAYVPVPAEFQQGSAVIFLFSDSPEVFSNVFKGGNPNGKINNILIQGRGKHVWLVDPMKAAQPPGPPSSPLPQPAPTGPSGGTGATGPSGP